MNPAGVRPRRLARRRDPNAVMEAALAHTVRNKAEAACATRTVNVSLPNIARPIHRCGPGTRARIAQPGCGMAAALLCPRAIS